MAATPSPAPSPSRPSKIYEERDILGPRPRPSPPAFLDGLAAFRDHPLVGDVRGVGLIAGVELMADKARREPFEFEERLALPMPAEVRAEPATIEGLLSLLHWIAGVSYYKAAVPERVTFAGDAPPPATAALLEALYSEGLGEFAAVNRRPLPRPDFGARELPAPVASPARAQRILVPVGGGKDSAVAIEIARRGRAETDIELFSIGNAAAIDRTVTASGLHRHLVRRTIDPRLIQLNAAGALNGHVPVTAIVTAAALLTAALHGLDAVALANERSASAGNLVWDGVEVNHQFSKSRRAELLLAAAAAEIPAAPYPFSILRPASELAIARAFARLPQYQEGFTSCNRIFQIDPALRLASWCCDCDKCRFVFLILAPFLDPDRLAAIFGAAMLDDPAQYDGFALLTATGGHKPWECVGEIEDSLAAIRLLAADPRWRERPVVRRLAEEVLAAAPPDLGDPVVVFALGPDDSVPAALRADVDAVLGA